MAPTTKTFKPSRYELLLRSAALDEEQARIKRQLAELEESTTADCYTSEDRPHRVSRRAFRERCCSGAVDGARREGQLWICSRDAWHRSRARSAPKLRIVPAQVADDEAIAAAALERVGLRPTRRSA
jgi:hypothetical protein